MQMEQKKLFGVFVIILAGSIVGTWAVTQFVFNAGNIPIRINGAGATFPAPLYQKWTEEFNALTGIQVDYEGIGSGGGINQFTQKTVDFGASDPPMNDEEWAAAPNTLQIPATIGGVIVIFNIPSVDELNLTGSVTAQIFALNITTWNDPAIVDLNPTASLPSNEITVVHRSDSSGTTAVFTSFLSDESSDWNATMGTSKKINWDPSTLGAKGNTGVCAAVIANQYSIGYTELAYTITNNLDGAYMQNANGTFSQASISTIAQAATAISSSLPAGDESWAGVGNYFKLSSGCGNAYPISSFSYLLVYKELNVVPDMTLAKANALTNFLWFGIHTGQYYADALYYVELPDEVVTIDVASLRSITFNGEIVNTWS